MKLKVIIEVKDSGVRYVAENNLALLSLLKFSQEKVHRICIRHKGNLKPEYRLCASMNSHEF